MRLLVSVMLTLLFVACGGSDGEAPAVPLPPAAPAPTATATSLGPGGYGFDRSDPESGIANIMAAFATDEATASCIFDAWGDVANLPPAELTPELMAFEVCGTSIFQLMTGDPRFTGQPDG